MKIKKVFLGGICSDNTWKDKLIPKLKIEYYQGELNQCELCDYYLYIITPRMYGIYSNIAQVVDDSNKRPNKVIFCVLDKEDDEYTFTEEQSKSLTKVGEIVSKNGGKLFKNLDEITEFLNSHYIEYNYSEIESLLREGKRITRLSWKNKDSWIQSIPKYHVYKLLEKIIELDHIPSVDDLIYRKDACNNFFIWVPMYDDIDADDYIIIE